MSESVKVDVVVTDAPFGIKGKLSVSDEVFEGVSRQEFSDGAGIEINRLSRELHELAMSEYDRRKNA